MPRDDVAFGFDPRPFMKGLGAITKGMDTMTKKVGSVAGQITRRLLVLGIAIKGAQKLWMKFNQYVPELGKSFKIAGNIFFKNFFWPIRKMIVPMLQRMLDWVRDHRTMFVRWGSVVANIFRSVVALGKQLIGIFRTIVDAVGPSFKRLFGTSFQNFLNVITVKMAVAFEFMGRLVRSIFEGMGKWLMPIIDNISGFVSAIWDLASALFQASDNGNSFWTVLDKVVNLVMSAVEFVTRLAKAFAEGLRDALGPGLMDALNGIVEAFQGMLAMLTGLDEKSGVFSKIAKGLGMIVGEAIIGGLHAIWFLLDGMQNMLEWMPLGLERLKAIGKPEEIARVRRQTETLNQAQSERTGRMFEIMGAYWGGQFKKWGELFGGKGPAETTARDAIITKRGEIIKLDPHDTVMAAREPGRMNVGAQNINITLNVTEGGARAAGMEFAAGLDAQFRQSLLDAGVAGGY